MPNKDKDLNATKQHDVKSEVKKDTTEKAAPAPKVPKVIQYAGKKKTLLTGDAAKKHLDRIVEARKKAGLDPK